MLPTRRQQQQEFPSLTGRGVPLHNGRSTPYLGEGRSRTIRINRGLIAETGVIPHGLHLIQDAHTFRPVGKGVRAVVEGKGGKEEPVFRITGLFQEGDKENANGRIYPREILEEAVKAIQEDLDRRSVMGEFDHPPDAKIHLDRISHLLTRVWMDGKKVYGEAEVLDNQPLGRCLRGLFERKVQVGISSRGVGDMEVRESGGEEFYEVLPGYAFVTWDAVAEPSVHGATLNVMEGLSRRTAPLRESRQRFSPETYDRLLLKEIDAHFGLGR